MARLIVGIQPVREAIRVHGAGVERVIIREAGGPQLEALARYAVDKGIPVFEAGRAELDREAGSTHHQGVAALAPPLKVQTLDTLELAPDALMVVLDQIQDPQNFGSVVRSAVALGSATVMFAEHASAPLSPATFRASAGAIEHASLCRVPSLVSALAWLTEQGVLTVGLDASATDELGEIELTGPVALVLGSEGKGLRGSVRRACTAVARLPMPGPIGSLNASVAAALALYEVLGQRRASASARP